MKKRLLITSIVMMLVVAVALSTATYAWFTLNSTVTANQVVLTAHVADAQSISIGWLGNETKSTSLTANNGGTGDNALHPMAPTVLTGTNAGAYDSSSNTTGVVFKGAYIDVNTNKFSDIQERIPYTWTDGSVNAFYINNDSNSKSVSISVSIADISNAANLTPLTDSILLQGSKKVYYKKVADGDYEKMVSGTATEVTAGTADYVANSTTVSQAVTNIRTALGAGHEEDAVSIYETKGVEDYVRVAIYASATQSSPIEAASFDPKNCTYKGLLAKEPPVSPNNDTVLWSASSAAPTTDTLATALDKVASSETVQVIAELPALNRVYVVVKVWLDGADFTQHEGGQQANVSLTFSAGAVA